MSLRDGDYIKGVAIVEEGKALLTITEKGKGKRTEFSDFRNMKNRGGAGYMCHNITDETGLIAGIASVGEDDDVMLITDKGTIIRTGVSSINTYSRTAAGVRVMNVEEDAIISNIVRIAPESEIEKEEEILKEEETTSEE